MRLNDYLKSTFGCKVYKLALSTGCTCPNRDGRCGTGGCAFCAEGSDSTCFADRAAGDGLRTDVMPIPQQIERAKAALQGKLPKSGECKYIGYFQSYTNTYGDVSELRETFEEAISCDDIVALSIGTRPDCLPDDMIEMLAELNVIKPVWIELGLQTIHDDTAEMINRGYKTEVFYDTYGRLKAAGLTCIVHVILGLPGETREDMLETVRALADLTPHLDGIKLQNLQILEGTVMAEQYRHEQFHIFTLEEYHELLRECVQLLPEGIVLHRITGDGPRRLLIEPKWSLDKKRVMNTLSDIYELQGKTDE